MICREMPATWEATFRPKFYAHWGRENCVISARARRAEYPDFEQCLSVKTVWKGTEEYFIDGRRVAIDEETFLVINERRTYASRIHALESVHSFSIFFRPGMATDVLNSLTRSEESLLDGPAAEPLEPIEFAEHVRLHDQTVTPVLRFISREIDAGTSDDAWLEEQLCFLLQRLFKLHRADLAQIENVSAVRPATRRELHHRIGLSLDFIHTCFRDPIDLAAMASAAYMSPYHFLRTFQAVCGMTPSAYLKRKRTAAALRAMRDSTWSMTEIAEQVGFGSRTTLFRHVRAMQATQMRKC